MNKPPPKRKSGLASQEYLDAVARKDFDAMRKFLGPAKPGQLSLEERDELMNGGQPQSHVEENGQIVARPLWQFERFKVNDPAELIKDRYLCRRGALLLCGPSGIGKSSLAMQLALAWAVGKSAFGFTPTGKLKSLFIQAENDDGDIAEMRDGVLRGLELSEKDATLACDNVLVIREDERTGQKFFDDVVRPLLEKHRPDIIWIDPALGYLGGDMSAQKEVGPFLRNMLNPLLREFECGCIVLHHVTKSSSKPRSSDPFDFLYSGAGSIEWTNWSRALLALALLDDGLFQLHAAKRGARLGWKDEEGGKSMSKYLAHSNEAGAIYWREPEPDEVAEATEKTKKGRPKDYDESDLLPLLPAEGLTSGEWKTKANKDLFMSNGTFFTLKGKLEKSGQVVKNGNRFLRKP
jgi:hypothetical protein